MKPQHYIFLHFMSRIFNSELVLLSIDRAEIGFKEFCSQKLEIRSSLVTGDGLTKVVLCMQFYQTGSCHKRRH